jgi:sulfur-oxidizing protein SoxZ
MAKSSIKVRAKEKGGVVTVKALMNHPMETGLRKDKKTGKMFPAHFINEVTATIGGANAIHAYWSGGISKNPYLAFDAPGKKGDELTLSWTDNQGNSESATTKVK